MVIKAYKGDEATWWDGVKAASGSLGIGECTDKLFRYVGKADERRMEFMPMHCFDRVEITINGDTAAFTPAPPVRINMMQR